MNNYEKHLSSSSLSKSDVLEAWADVDDHIDFLSNILHRPNIQDETKAEFESEFAKIRLRRTDPNLYLAVVGEFSSGKSTFINALLRDDLLKTQPLVTTGVATYIRYKDSLDISVDFKKQKKNLLYSKDKNQLWSKIETLAPKLYVINQDVRQFLYLATSNEDVTQEIVKVTIFHPANFLSNNIVIIDTPGSNVENESHHEITKKVISQSDAAVIVIPSDRPVSSSLVNFLSGPLRPFLHRCLFIVTKMDMIRKPNEQERLLNIIQTRLADFLEIEKPIVYASAPQIVIDVLEGEEVVPPKKLKWQGEFEEMEIAFWEHLQRQRVVSVTEHVLRLLNQVYKKLDIHLNYQITMFGEHQQEIEQETIRDLPSFTLEQITKGRQKIDNTMVNVRTSMIDSVYWHKNTTKDKINQMIFEAGSSAELKQIVAEQIEPILMTDTKDFYTELQEVIKTINNRGRKVVKDFDKRFMKEYKRLKSLNKRLDYTELPSESEINIDLSDTLAPLDKFQKVFEKQSNLFWKRVFKTGFWLGVVAALTPITWPVAVGGAILAGIGHLVFAPSLDDRKSKFWEELEPKLNEHFNVLENESLDILSEHIATLQELLEQHINTYMDKYKKVVQHMQLEQDKEARQLQYLRRYVQSDLEEITRRRKVVQHKQEQMINITI
ncbi:MAG: dynamin family protein [Candidatus Heimdallarchaeota archaeon]